jgi:hypothetical protein
MSERHVGDACRPRMPVKGDALLDRRRIELFELHAASADAPRGDDDSAADDSAAAGEAFDTYEEVENLKDEWTDPVDEERWNERTGMQPAELRYNRRRMYLDDAYRQRRPKARRKPISSAACGADALGVAASGPACMTLVSACACDFAARLRLLASAPGAADFLCMWQELS